MGTVNFLLVEDDIVDVKAVKKVFCKLKVANSLYVAESGLEALDMLRGESIDKVPHPRVILLDINMPLMNGHEFLEVVRNDHELSSTDVFVLSTSDAPSDIEKANDKNVAGYFLKQNFETSFLDKMRTLGSYAFSIQLAKK
jgi:CheY-like chemotaxis protein